MKRSLISTLTVLLTGLLLAQGEPISAPPITPRIVLEQTVVPQKDGGSVTFQKIVPPPLVAASPSAEVMLSAEDLAVMQRQEGKEVLMVSLSATVHAQGTLLYCVVGEQKASALSRLDFRLLEGTGMVETDTQVISLFLAAGADERPIMPELAARAQTLAPDGFVLLDMPPDQASAEKVLTALQALHAFVGAHQATLAARREQRQAEQAARNEAERNAPPPPPRHSVIQFWPLSAEQKIALRAVHNPEPANAGTTNTESTTAEQPVIETSPAGGTN